MAGVRTMFVFGLYVLWLLVQTVIAEVRQFNFTIGEVTTFVYYNPNTTGPVAYIKTHQTDTAIYLLQVTSLNGTASAAICRNANTIPIIVGSRGCDSSVFGEAVESSNCFRTDEEASDAALIIQQAFPYTYGSSECIAARGDITSCFGPLYVIRQQESLSVSRVDLITDQILIDSQGVMVPIGGGQRGDAVGVTWLPIRLPKIMINTTTCSDSTSASFAGSYQPSYVDGSAFVLVNDTRIYKKLTTATHQRLILKRNSTTTFLTLGRVDFDGSETYQTVYSSNVAVNSSWTYDLPKTYHFNNACIATIYLDGLATGVLNLEIPEQLTDVNYDKHKQNGHYLVTAFCNIHPGYYDTSFFLAHPFTADGELGGGFVDWTTGGLVAQDIQVNPDYTFRDYELDCGTFWPSERSFRSYGLGYNPVTKETSGILTLPYIAETYMCNAPFPNPLAIHESQGNDVGVRYNQCYKLGGVVAGRALQYCRRPIMTQKCMKGSLYFDEHCYRPFDPTTDGKFKTTNALADDACRQWIPEARSLKQLDNDLKSWLMGSFVFRKRVEPGHGYRVNLQGKRCISFDYIASPSGIDFDVPLVQDVSCETHMFHICRYHHKDYVVPHSEERWDPPSIRIQRDGQEGKPHPGKQLGCNCLNGWTAPYCSTATCGLSSVVSDEPLSLWFSLCYLHGSCEDGQPRSCACHIGYGPDAHYGAAEAYHSKPCACPASSIFEPYVSTTFKIDGILYPMQNPDQLMCGGTSNGECSIEPNLNHGTCICANRTNMNPESKIKTQPAFGDPMCVASVPFLAPNQIQLNGDKTEVACDAHGTACPSGFRFAEQRLNEITLDMLGRETCRTRNGQLISGCVCDPGWAGLECTCPVPLNVLKPNLYRRIDTNTAIKSVYGLFSKRESVQLVEVDRQGCPTIDHVYTQDGETTTLTECTPTIGNWTWTCHGTYATRLVLTSVFDPLTCLVKAYNTWHPPCGNHTNPYAGRFYEVEPYRSFDLHMYPQPADFAPYGCQSSECMCDPNYTGELCAAAISGYRYDLSGVTTRREVCGASTVPPRGVLTDDGTCECNYREGTFESRFVGEACELEEVKSDFPETAGEFLMCNGEHGGVPIPRDFPYGSCESDLMQREADPLKNLFVNVNPDIDDRSSIFTVSNNNTIVRLFDGFEWKFWRFFSGQKITVESLQPLVNSTLVEYCGQVPFPLNFTYVCECSTQTVAATIADSQVAVVPIPQRVRAVVTVWAVDFTCDSFVVDVGDPTCYETAVSTETGVVIQTINMCPTDWTTEINYVQVGYSNIQYRCIKEIEWVADDDHEFERLETGRYVQSEFLCFGLQGNSRTSESLIYGKFDYSDPLDRVFADVGEYRGLIPVRPESSTSTTFGHFSGVLGKFYGLFYRSLPGMSPFDKEWTEEHYRYIGSLLNDLICIVSETQLIAERAFDGQTMNYVALALYDNTEVERVTQFNASDTREIETRVYLREEGRNATFVGLAGNPYIHLLDNVSEYTFGGGRPGWMITIPTGDEVLRAFSIQIPFSGMAGLQVYGPLGSICTTQYRPQVNDIVNVDGCGTALMENEPRWKTLLRMRNHTDLLPGFDALKPQHPITLVWWMEDTVGVPSNTTSIPVFTYGDISTKGRLTGYTGLFSGIKKSVYVDHRWPASDVYETQCLARAPGRELRALNYSSPTDLDYLKRIYYAHLGPRFCTHTWQCQLFARDPEHYQCVFDGEFAEPWLGGDKATAPSIVGTEGGCLCSEGFAPHPCKTCDSGYGPATYKEILDYRRYYNTTVNPERCSLPWTEKTTKQVGACGGRAIVSTDQSTLDDFTIHLFEDNKTRRCTGVDYNGTTLLLNTTNDFTLDVMRYGTQLAVVDRRVFYQGTELTISALSEDNSQMTFTNGATLTCNEVLGSRTHDRKWAGYRFIASKVNFWIARLAYHGLWTG